MFTDTHAHLSWPAFADDLPSVLERARAAGVTRIVSIATDLASACATIALAERHDGIGVAVGLHPGDIPDVSLAGMPEIAKLATHPKVVAIGETGLDYFREARKNHALRQQQRDLFWAHLGLSKERRLPAVIHSRDSDADMLEIVEAHAEALPKDWRPWGVMHCFTGDAKMAFACIEAGLMISFAGILTFKNSATMRDVAAKIPLDCALLETDAPYLAPEPNRGQRNEPAYLPLTAAALAQIRDVSVEEVARVTSANAERLFGRMP
ncbi:MAG: TatD family deoxyribonuclease [Verrucomicrobia bacterium]|nr:TatD family deoxyribonuclease [Verrucomicrobiota bacterium]